MRELRAQVTLPGEPEAAELSQGQSPEPGCSTHTHSRNILHCLGQTTTQSILNRPLTVLCRASLFRGTGTEQKTHLQLQIFHHYHQHQRSCLNISPKLARGQSVTSASPNCALYDTALDDSLCQYSWLLFLLGKTHVLP